MLVKNYLAQLKLSILNMTCQKVLFPSPTSSHMSTIPSLSTLSVSHLLHPVPVIMLSSQVRCLHSVTLSRPRERWVLFFFLGLIIYSSRFILLGVSPSCYTGPALFALPCPALIMFHEHDARTHKAMQYGCTRYVATVVWIILLLCYLYMIILLFSSFLSSC